MTKEEAAENIGRPMVPTEKRFWDNVRKRKGGCWLWVGHRDRDGYGRFLVYSRRSLI